MPEGQDVLVGLKAGQRDDFDFGKAAAFVKAKNNRGGQIPPGTHGETARTRSMMNPERSRLEPIRKENGIDGGQSNHQQHQQTLFFIHIFCNAADPRPVNITVKTHQPDKRL
jgi:hypothetical protein